MTDADASLRPMDQEILRRQKLGEPARSIAAAIGVGVDTVYQCVSRLRARGLLPITCKGGVWAAFPDRRARLVADWADGYSVSQIAQRLGVSKNAVVGAGHRLDLPARPSPIIRDGAPRPPRVRHLPRPAPLPSMAHAIPELPEAPREIAPDIAVAATPRAAPRQGQASFDEHRCRWRLNDRRPYLWCDEPCTTRLGLGSKPVWSSYCDLHHRICWQPAPRYRQAVDV